jgi:hypothetical protein
VILTTVPHEIDTADALLVTRVAQALRVWRQLGLELGEAAVYTDGGDLADLIGLLAKWHGGMPVIRLTDTDVAPLDGIQDLAVHDATTAVAKLRAMIAQAPAVAAVDLSGRGSVIGVLLEALPRWGRLMLAGPPPDAFTTAFYTDVHRKGTIVCAAGDLDAIAFNPAATDARAAEIDVRNARRLLTNAAYAAELRACLARGRAAIGGGA